MDKQQILDEIERTATANGGVPLGRTKFFEMTGIKESDWSGKYWAKWNDAIAEAGYSPNQMQGSFDNDYLLERYATVIRDLGHIPTNAEVRLYARSSPGFPSHNTFSRLGSKEEIVSRVLLFCQEREEFKSVAEICTRAAVTPAAPSTNEPTISIEAFGFVHLIKAGRYYKIGRTNSLGRRERELAIHLPEASKTVHSIRTDDPSGIEAYWHRRFSDKRKNGEWFDLSAADVLAFKRRKFM